MSTTGPEPLRVYDARTLEWHAIEWSPRWEQLCAWMSAEGIDPTEACRIEVYLVDAPYAVVTERLCDERGRRVIDEVREAYVTTTRTVLLSSLPPSGEERPV